MSDQDVPEVDYQTVRRRVVRRFFKRLLFAVDGLLWLLFTLINFRSGYSFYESGDATFAFFWFLLLIVHFAYAFEIWSRIIDRMTQREIENLQRKGYRVVSPPSAPPRKLRLNDQFPSGKQKREPLARLSDDGEIVYEEPAEVAEQPHAKWRRQNRSK